MNEGEEQKSNTWFLQALIICSIISVGVSFFFFYFKKDFEVTIEVACDPSLETCFERDCSNPDDCPRNNLSDFKRYILNAQDFKSCQDFDCKSSCENVDIKCVQIKCVDNPDWGESCVSPIPYLKQGVE